MIIREVFQNIIKILIPKNPLLVEQTSAMELLNISSPDAELSAESSLALDKGAFKLTPANFGELLKRKFELIEKYRDVAPRIDKEILWRI